MIHHPDWAAARPIDTPLLRVRARPEGQGDRRGDARRTARSTATSAWPTSTSTCPWRVLMTAGHRARRRRGRHQRAGRRTRSAPGTSCATTACGRRSPRRSRACPAARSGWRAIDAERPEGERHLAVHEGHVTNVMPRDREVLGARRRRAGDHRLGRHRRARSTSVAVAAAADGCHRAHVHARRRLRPRDAQRSPRPCAADAATAQNSTSSSSSSSGSRSRGRRSTRPSPAAP